MQVYAKKHLYMKGVFYMNKNEIKPKAFQCYLDNYTLVKHLSDEEAGELWKMLFRLAIDGEHGQSDSDLVNMVFSWMANKLERDFSDYARKVELNRENGKKGGAPKGNRNAAKN